jgi:hypothetical protein
VAGRHFLRNSTTPRGPPQPGRPRPALPGRPGQDRRQDHPGRRPGAQLRPARRPGHHHRPPHPARRRPARVHHDHHTHASAAPGLRAPRHLPPPRLYVVMQPAALAGVSARRPPPARQARGELRVNRRSWQLRGKVCLRSADAPSGRESALKSRTLATSSPSSGVGAAPRSGHCLRVVSAIRSLRTYNPFRRSTGCHAGRPGFHADRRLGRIRHTAACNRA